MDIAQRLFQATSGAYFAFFLVVFHRVLRSLEKIELISIDRGGWLDSIGKLTNFLCFACCKEKLPITKSIPCRNFPALSPPPERLPGDTQRLRKCNSGKVFHAIDHHGLRRALRLHVAYCNNMSHTVKNHFWML